ncbi:transcription factor LHW [Manihot esculenta]|uniref:BHLH domain-containing protein n=1 Tax=Manihot esculenta TaxID=3983 RepID=A0A2C9W1B4_MANES|nr:transcription factor LHW [Manihot esculenta]OAY52128.1 hypothetical protein MANES_04G060100v8 [Manihot esculenta]
MGHLLRDVLRSLCGVNQWCYAVFWKIGCQNPKLLIWEECYYESKSCSVLPCTSGTGNPELPLGDSEGCWASDFNSPQLRVQSGETIHLLMNKMMINNQINIVGQGMVGRAAFTGNHEWILANNYIGDAYPPEVLTEIHHQFSAGMQTVAVIPVSPLGVVQFGSSLTIMENMGFVNNVKSLILQIGCVPGALLSENLMINEFTERIGVPVSIGMSDSHSMHLSGNKMQNSTPLLTGSCNQQNISSRSSIIAQPSHLQIRQVQDNLQSTASTFRALNLTSNSSKSGGGSCEQKMTTIKQDDPLRGQLENGVGAEVIRSNPDVWLNQHVASLNSKPAFSPQSVISQSHTDSSIMTLLEHQVLSDAIPQNLISNNRNALDSFATPNMRSNEALVFDSHGDSLAHGTELRNGVSSHTTTTSIKRVLSNPQKSAGFNHSSTQLAGIGIQNSNTSRAEEIPSSHLVDQLSGRGMLSGGPHRRYISSNVKYAKNVSIAKKEKMEDDLFQAFYLPSSQPNSVPDCLRHASESQITNSTDIKYEDPCAQPASGDDLYDILGVDFKNRLLKSKWDNLLTDGQCANSHLGKDASTFINMREASSSLLSVNQGISDSCIFSGMGTDNLLDAVVSRAHSAAKQRSDENISCKTTLTKISSSSVPSGSLTYGLVHMSEKIQKELFDLPKSLEKSGTIASGSFRSGCSKDDVGSCSQTSSVYGSQLSSWVGPNNRRDNSVSTAYSKKNDESSKPNRKRLKPGENPRPRPKDRQMIQDRVKELREIVPNGGKCSIDALLERTIKHMQFLQSVTKHADKLKQTGDSKIINKEGGLLLKENFDGGATWAFEVGSQSMVCPIIVEDLNPPRQMLVEMLCEERGFFLEIADLIRGLGLTILKGVMEAWNDKIWARFTVEANRDVTRMEVFMSLVRLLEQTVKGGVSSTAASDMMVHHAFPQAASIPATGRPTSLQ